MYEVEKKQKRDEKNKKPEREEFRVCVEENETNEWVSGWCATVGQMNNGELQNFKRLYATGTVQKVRNILHFKPENQRKIITIYQKWTRYLLFILKSYFIIYS